MMDIHNTGKKAEQEACSFLRKQGLQLLQQNYRCRNGEIDLIMQDKDCIVFVEVRARNNTYFANAIESINYPKQQKIIKAATYYLIHQNSFDKVNCRFDVIGISYRQTKASVEWIKSAFTLN